MYQFLMILRLGMESPTTLQQMKNLLDKAKKIPSIALPEKTIFDIGSRGYYENPTTEILAFFCDDNEVHGLGSLVLKALIQSLPEKHHGIDCSLLSIPEREVVTKSGKRIDLLLENQQWVIVLENKIYHEQNNPFQDYEDFVLSADSNRFKSKESIFVVLSPSGKVSEDCSTRWSGISYLDLVEAIKRNLASYFIAQPFNKWLILLREFTLHLEGMFMHKPLASSESIDFVLENLSAIQELQNLKQKAIDEYHQKLQRSLQEVLGKIVNIRLHHWSGFPALRFALDDWKNTDSDVVLSLDGNEKQPFTIYCYLHLVDKGQFELADDFLNIKNNESIWEENNGSFRGSSTFFTEATTEMLVLELAAKIRLLDKFERTVRPPSE